jgi:hypothetical protein
MIRHGVLAHPLEIAGDQLERKDRPVQHRALRVRSRGTQQSVPRRGRRDPKQPKLGRAWVSKPSDEQLIRNVLIVHHLGILLQSPNQRAKESPHAHRVAHGIEAAIDYMDAVAPAMTKRLPASIGRCGCIECVAEGARRVAASSELRARLMNVMSWLRQGINSE